VYQEATNPEWVDLCEAVTRQAGVMYYVYLMANRKHGTLYIGVTRDLIRRAYEHRTSAVAGFTSRYPIRLLVWFECYEGPLSAIARKGT
jgi:putative endonuclease